MRRRPLHTVFALGVTFSFFALAELLCRWLAPTSWLYAESGNPLIPKTVLIEKRERAEYLDVVRQAADDHPALSIDPVGGQYVLQPEQSRGREPRWFLLGGSAARGWEVPPDSTIAAQLSEMLTGPPVVNGGWIAFNIEQIIGRAVRIVRHHNPAGLILYAGNNEFIGWHYPVTPRLFGVDVSALTPLLERSVAYGTLARLYRSNRARAIEKPAQGRWFAKRSVVDDGFCAKYPYEPEPAFDRGAWMEVKRKTLRHAKASVEAIAGESAAGGVPLVLCTVPINAALSPCYFLRQPASLDRGKAVEIEPLLAEGWKRMEKEDFEGARETFEEAATLDPNSSLALNGLGMALLKNGDLERGTNVLREAREHTIGYLGGLVTHNENIRRIANEKGLPLCDLDRLFVEESLRRGGPLHDGLFQDYCHPTTRGNRLIAEALAETIRNSE